MTYKITGGIDKRELTDWLKNAAAKFGTFKDGRVDYTKADIAPIVMCTIIYDQEILLAKRGFGLADAEGYWSTINGFIDEIKPVKDQAKQEIKEELAIDIETRDVKIGNSYILNNPQEKRRYIVFPCLVKLNVKPKIVLSEEHTEYVWTIRDKVGSYKILDDLLYAIDAALAA